MVRVPVPVGPAITANLQLAVIVSLCRTSAPAPAIYAAEQEMALITTWSHLAF